MDQRLLLSLAVALDYLLGDPLWWPHPVCAIGWVISTYEGLIRCSRLSLKVGGYVLAGLTMLTVLMILTFLLWLARLVHPVVQRLLVVYFLYSSLAAKSLRVAAMKVYRALHEGDLEGARYQLSHIVGRDTQKLDRQGIIKAAVETVAENTIDGVLAPLFFIGLGIMFQVPVQLVYLYKTINTLDSMVGYVHEPYREIGYASAKLDDLVNLIPARVGSLLMLIAGALLGGDLKAGWRIWHRDHRKHKSPNSGHPEAVVAGLLQIQLGGSNTYFGQVVHKPTIGDFTRTPDEEDIRKAIRITYGAQVLGTLCFLVLL
ncbi:MAG: adenosylcobinamide-phosphate synthase CbiB [Limnochordia bacterium]|nr:adenosylcobinamide-phosphate synthase CbiB [Limnochordia bacterium]